MFLIFYSGEIILKLLALFEKYFKSWWNILDFTIVFTGYYSLIFGSASSISSLRIIRVLRPFRTLSKI